MSFMITVPPAIIQNAQVYANEQGTTVDSLVVEYLASLGRKKVDKDKWLSNWERLVSESSGTTTEPYVFNRADAYGEDEFA